MLGKIGRTQLYGKQGPKQLYRKLFGIYTAIILGVVVLLAVFFCIVSKLRIKETNLEKMYRLKSQATSYLEQCSNTADHIQSELFRTETVLDDLLFYFRNDPETYLSNRLTRYSKLDTLTYNGFDTFTENILKANEDILHIDYIFYESGELTACYPGNKIYKNVRREDYIEQIKNGNLVGGSEFSFLKEIRDLKAQDGEILQSLGCMLVTYPADRFETLMEEQDWPEIVVLSGKGSVVADPSGKFSPQELILADQEGRLEALTGCYTARESVGDYTVYVFYDKALATRLPWTLFLMILGAGVIVFILGEALVNLYLRRLAMRLDYILDGMHKVTVGDLDVRLTVNEKGDELDLIGANFNEMCGQLDRYIQKSYLAEIEQKNAEMEVLQNQINPHFLYNTLEAIRMKAVINKDRDVAKMLYSMSVIFRSQLKDDNVISLVQELHYCKKYMELFEYRYTGKFSFQIDCPEEYMQLPVIKFIVQPILENYFAHGIRSESEGNRVHIYVETRPPVIEIHVVDNGMGMTDEALEQMNKKLRENTDNSRKSIGLLNVNRRLRAVYGKECGVHLAHGEDGGLHVTLIAEMGETNGMEKGTVD